MFKRRLKYYVAAYVMGYIISLINAGIPNPYYLIPIKLLAIIMALIAGNGSYYIVEEKELIFTATFRSIKYVFLSVVLTLIFVLLQKFLLQNYNIDITPFIGM